MRGSAAVVSLVLLLLPACKDKASAPAPKPVIDEASLALERDLVSRRDSLLAARQELTTLRSDLETKLIETRQAGGDTTELQGQLDALSDKQSANQSALVALLTDQNAAMRGELDALRAQGGGADQLAQVNAQLARRDAELKGLQDKLNQMSTTLGRLADDVQKQAAACQAGAASTTIVQTIEAPKGSKYTKRDVEPLLNKARATMSKRGLLSGDLPTTAQGLEKEATAAMGDGDFGRAYLAANQLAQTAAGLPIDKAFIAAKVQRLSRQLKGRQLEAGVQKQVDELFADAIKRHGDDDFGGANRALNQIVNKI